ncbi:cell division protein ZapE [Brevibacterium sp. SMBL_HHYL_HB1]|uniref:cell division protein ZapE n=1 Tax=Brevibacterium sp. SMBL_HHYL_HB1 TaxID=2777556 RepID=UPI001BA84B83|nr:cell division protein ZapE [Brevibacterium sp. SMBL_HHYL_HB1]QUL80327.1 cell division protein ZapE [Brevibacterium sp. SMBL_HHYL_HB1]
MNAEQTLVALSDRSPQVAPEELIAGLVPPPQFADVSFDSYRTDPNEPSQEEARTKLRQFTQRSTSTGLLGRLFSKGKSGAKGVYLDGGYGVGKTHLLASAWHANDKPATFGTFVEYTNLVGALGFVRARDDLSEMKLVCVDEFELDDPGDTVLMSRLMRELTDAGVKIIATSNTLPGSLGEGRFAAQDFLREIQALADQFEVYRIDGQDYRHRALSSPARPLPEGELTAAADELDGVVARDDFSQLLAHLSTVHPSRYGRMVDGIDAAVWENVTTIENESVALRFVALVDRLYDRNVHIINSGAPLDEIFTEESLAGGYRKKYMRCLSRLTALSS